MLWIILTHNTDKTIDFRSLLLSFFFNTDIINYARHYALHNEEETTFCFYNLIQSFCSWHKFTITKNARTNCEAYDEHFVL